MRRDNRALRNSASRRVGVVLCWLLVAAILLVVAGCGSRRSAEDALSGEPSGSNAVSTATPDEPSADAADGEPSGGETIASAEKPAAATDTGTDVPASDSGQDVALTTPAVPSKPTPDSGSLETPGVETVPPGAEQAPAAGPGKPATGSQAGTPAGSQAPSTPAGSQAGTPAGLQAPSTPDASAQVPGTSTTPSSIGKPAPSSSAGSEAPNTPDTTTSIGKPASDPSATPTQAPGSSVTGSESSPGKPSPVSSAPVAETTAPVQADIVWDAGMARVTNKTKIPRCRCFMTRLYGKAV